MDRPARSQVEIDLSPGALPGYALASVVLPHVAIGDLMGLVEHLHEAGGRQDLYVLARDLQLEVDELLP